MKIGDIWTVAKDAAKAWSTDGAPQLAAAIAFYTIFALAPLVLLTIRILGVVYGDEQAREEVAAQMEGFAGREGSEVVKTVLANANQPEGGALSTVLGIGFLLVAATGLFAQLKLALNTVWDVEPRPGRGAWNLIMTRLTGLVMILLVAALLLASVVASTTVAGMARWASDLLPMPGIALQAINIAVQLAVITLLFGMVFRFLPDAKVVWKEVWIGAFITSLLFVIGNIGISMYLGRSSLASAYGAAGSLIVVLLWVYYSGLIVLFGAEVTQAHAAHLGRDIEPAPHAQRKSHAPRARKGREPKEGPGGRSS